MLKHFFVLFLCIGLSLPAFSQQALAGDLNQEDRDSIFQIEDTLAVLSYTFLNDSLPQNRFGAVRKFIPTLVRALKTTNSFDYKFERLPNVSIQYPRDSSFRVFSWHLYVDVNEYRYYGAIQMNTADLRLFPLRDRSFDLEGNLEQLTLSPDNWYGAVYYNLKEVKTKEGTYYLLFGFDRNELFRTRKVMDVLSFNDQGQPFFGAPVIPGPRGEMKKRLILEYSAEASVRLNYDEALGIIIHDHLTTISGKYDEGPVNVGDGSYEGFKITKDGLEYIPKVFDFVSETPPRPFPVLDTERKKKGNQP
jgi:hypothetical protein